MIHLHGHSHYSLLEAIGKPSNIIQKAKNLNMSAIALTDYSGMYGAVEFYQGCKGSHIRPIIGVELGLVYDITKKAKNEDTGNIVLIAKNYQGYKNLLKITSLANLDGYRSKARVDFTILEKYGTDIISFMGGTTSFLGKLILQNESTSKIQELIARFHSIFDNNFYLELIAQNEKEVPGLQKINQKIIELATATNTRLFCNTNFHYIEKEDKEAASVALSIKDGKRIYDENRRKVQGEYHITTEDETKNIMTKNGYNLSLIQEALDMTETIAQQIDIEIPLGKILFPKYESGEKIQKRYEEKKNELIEKG